MTCHHNTDHPPDSWDTPHTVRMGYIMPLQTQTWYFYGGPKTERGQKRQIMGVEKGYKNETCSRGKCLRNLAIKPLIRVNEHTHHLKIP